ncbi:MAG: hypothetical protein AAGC60_23540 [Acidobacteriota bacterium]
MAYSTIYYLADWPSFECTWRLGGLDAVEDALDAGARWLTFFEDWPDDPQLFMPTSSAQVERFLVAWNEARERADLEPVQSVLCRLGLAGAGSRPPQALDPGRERPSRNALTAIPPADAADLLKRLARVDLVGLEASMAVQGDREPVFPTIRWVVSLLTEAARLHHGVLVLRG